jgi:large subunit ribosomal protein L30
MNDKKEIKGRKANAEKGVADVKTTRSVKKSTVAKGNNSSLQQVEKKDKIKTQKKEVVSRIKKHEDVKVVLEKASVKKIHKEIDKATKNLVTEKKIKVQQIISGAGRIKSQIQTLIGLGLNRMHKISALEDTPSVRGMINKVKHLVKIID